MSLSACLPTVITLSESADNVVMDEVMYQALKWMQNGTEGEKETLRTHWPKLLEMLAIDIDALNEDLRYYQSGDHRPTDVAMHELLAMLNTATLLDDYEHKNLGEKKTKTKTNKNRKWFVKNAKDVLHRHATSTTFFFCDVSRLLNKDVSTWAKSTKTLRALTSSVTMTYYARQQNLVKTKKPLELCKKLFGSPLYSPAVSDESVFLQLVYLSTHVLMTFTDFGMKQPARPPVRIAKVAISFLKNSVQRLLDMSTRDLAPSPSGRMIMQVYDALAETVEVLLCFEPRSVDRNIISFLDTVAKDKFGIDRVEDDLNKLHGIFTVVDALHHARTATVDLEEEELAASTQTGRIAAGRAKNRSKTHKGRDGKSKP